MGKFVRKYSLDESYLDEIDCPEKAYFLGFFCADGYHDARNRCIRMKLAEKDKHILETFSLMFNSNKPLYLYKRTDGQNQYELALASGKLSNRLIELGIPLKKTHELEFPEYISSQYMRDFLRGYFDGDGTIGVYGANKTSFSILGTEKFCVALKDYWQKELDIHCSIIKYPQKYKGSTVVLAISGNKQISKVLDYLYANSHVYLDRKMRKYDDFVWRRLLQNVRPKTGV
jgi:hypothetical protein